MHNQPHGYSSYPTNPSAYNPSAYGANATTTIIGADPETRQQRLLKEATRRSQEQSYYLRRAMDKDDLSTSLDYATNLLTELAGTEQQSHHHQPIDTLTPRNYYELHMRITDEMPNIEEFLLSFSEAPEKNKPPAFRMTELYEIVQYCPRVVPRLYLQICAGSALIRSNEVAVKDVLGDLIEVVKSVQCPLRGLFLRSYLLQALKDKLPDVANPAEVPTGGVFDFLDDSAIPQPATESTPREVLSGGSLEDSYDFVLKNFVEMNKLWCRIHHIPGERGNREVKKRRDKERHELRILVGTNLVRLSQLDGITPQIYKDSILPKILEQITSCNDALAQAYLMDCVIQVFPDEFHLYTLNEFLSVCPKLKEKVNIRTILHSMMERLTNYAKGAGSGDDVSGTIITFDAFKLFEDCITKTCIAKGANMAPKEVIRMETALLNFSMKCYPGKLEHVNSCLGVCANALAAVQNARGSNDTTSLLDEDAVEELEKLLSIPLDSLNLQVLELPDYSNLLKFLPWENWRQVAVVMLRAVSNAGKKLDNLKQIEELFAIIGPLLRDPGTVISDAADDDEFGLSMAKGSSDVGSSSQAYSDEFRAEQALVARLVHLFSHNDTDELFKMMVVARKHFLYGGGVRMQHTIPSLVFATLPLLLRIHKAEYDVKMPDLPPPPAPPAEGSLIDMGGETTPDSKVTEEVSDKKTSTLDALLTLTMDDDAPQTGAEETQLVMKETQLVPKETQLVPKETQLVAAEPGPLVAKKSTSLLLDLGVFEEENPEDNIGSTTDRLFGDDLDGANGGDAMGGVIQGYLPSSAKVITSRKVFLFLQKLTATLSSHSPELTLKLALELSLTASKLSTRTAKSAKPPSQSLATAHDFNTIAYEFATQAFGIYENDISESKAQSRAIAAMVGTLLESSRAYEKEEYQNLITKTAQYGAKLLKKPDQCRMVTLCSHLFYTTNTADDEEDEEHVEVVEIKNYQKPQRVLECLQRSLKIADACGMVSPASSSSSASTSVNLFIEILDHYVYYFEHENPVITHKFVSGLMALIKEHLGQQLGGVGAMGFGATQQEGGQAYFEEIVKYIQRKKMDEDTKERFAPIMV